MSIKFTQAHEIESNCGPIPVYSLQPTGSSTNKSKYWLSIKDVISIMLHHQQENLVPQSDGEIMVPLNLTLSLLYKMEMDDFSIGTSIDALKQLGFPTPPL